MTRLREVNELLQTQGWRQGSIGRVGEPVCEIGALRTIYGGEVVLFPNFLCTMNEHLKHRDFMEYMADLNTVHKVIIEQYPDRVTEEDIMEGRAIPVFNDHTDTTLDDIIRVNEKAAIMREESR